MRKGVRRSGKRGFQDRVVSCALSWAHFLQISPANAVAYLLIPSGNRSTSPVNAKSFLLLVVKCKTNSEASSNDTKYKEGLVRQGAGLLGTHWTCLNLGPDYFRRYNLLFSVVFKKT